MHNYAADPLNWRASPLLAESHQGLAPAVIITAEFDPLRDQGKAYADKLEAAGVQVTHTNYDGMVHAFFQLSPLCDAGKAAITQIAEAAKAALA
jgi:acetyl esterase